MESKALELGLGTQHIVVTTRNLPPLVGGMEKLVVQVCRALSDEFDVSVIGPKGCKQYLDGIDIEECVVSPIYWFLFSSLIKTWSECRRKRPAIILGGSGLMAPAVRLAAHRTGAVGMCYLHGLDVVSTNRLYRAFFLPQIRRMDMLLVNSKSTRALARQYGISENKLRVLHPCVDVDVRVSERSDIDKIRAKHGLQGKTVLLTVGRLTARKGISEFIRGSLRRIKAAVADAVLVVVGEEANQAVRGPEAQKALIVAAAEETGLAESVRTVGSVDDRTLGEFYQAADLFIFPVIQKPGDIEGFGIVAVEAAARGLPTVAFAVGGIPDAVCDHVSGYLIPPGDYQRFAEVVIRHISENKTATMRDGCRAFAQEFSPFRFQQKLIDYCNEAYESEHK